MTQPQSSFYGLGIAPKLLDRLERLGFTKPTPIQEKAIPPATQGKDLIGVAQTGTGKTLAFVVPMLQRLAQTKGRGLIILPTRELALQVDEVFQKVGQTLQLRTVVLIGGAPLPRQVTSLRRNPHVIIATPGRLIDHLETQGLKLHDVRILVLDEADRMLDMGFAPQIKKIFAAIPKQRQTMLFSATMPAEIVKLASAQMQLPLRVEVAPPGTAAERVKHELFVVHQSQKPHLLEKMLGEYQGTVLVFTRTKHGAKKLTRILGRVGHTVAELHSNRSLAQRKAALDGFKTGRYRVLVATDIAARGIDVTGIELVLNFDLPMTPDDYIHRIGRTGRAGKSGQAISFATPEQQNDVRAIERLLRLRIPVSQLPNLPAQPLAPAPTRPQRAPAAHRAALRRGVRRFGSRGPRRRFR